MSGRKEIGQHRPEPPDERQLNVRPIDVGAYEPVARYHLLRDAAGDQSADRNERSEPPQRNVHRGEDGEGKQRRYDSQPEVRLRPRGIDVTEQLGLLGDEATNT